MKSNQHYGLPGSVNEMGIEKRSKDVHFTHGDKGAAATKRDLPSTGWLKDEANHYHDNHGVWPNALRLIGLSRGSNYTAFMVGDSMVRLDVTYGAIEDKMDFV